MLTQSINAVIIEYGAPGHGVDLRANEVIELRVGPMHAVFGQLNGGGQLAAKRFKPDVEVISGWADDVARGRKTFPIVVYLILY